MLNIEEAASILRVPPNTVMSWLRNGYLESLDEHDVELLRQKIFGESE